MENRRRGPFNAKWYKGYAQDTKLVKFRRKINIAGNQGTCLVDMRHLMFHALLRNSHLPHDEP
eukprot:scaffold5490_cov125-Cylindrotheca_fusiformis.AAC.23